MFDPAVTATLLIGLESARRDLWGANGAPDALGATKRYEAGRRPPAAASLRSAVARRVRAVTARRAPSGRVAARPSVG